MIDFNFKLWLNESLADEYKDYLISWMSSIGTFLPNEGMTHVDAAMDLAPTASSPEEAREILFNDGYMRINYSNGILYANNPRVMPNPRQIAYLKELPKELDYIDEIVYDNDRSTQTLWSRKDKL